MRHICASIVATLALVGTSFAATINVPADYATIQAAVDAASDGDEIVVAPGTYTGTGSEVVNTLGKAITIKASGTPEETIIDGEDTRRGIVCSSGETAETIIDGFTITGGGSSSGGAGLYCNTSSPTITACTISGNIVTSDGEGGGIYCIYASNPTLTDCTISNNVTGSRGGGICCQSGSSPTITDCTISNNIASFHWGGGIYCSGDSSPMLTGCTISGNTAADSGGGIYCFSGGSPTLTACIISGNFAGGLGGGIGMSSDSSCELQATSICSNVPAESQVSGDYTDNGGNTIAEVCPWYQGACCTGNELACVVATEEDCEYFGLTWLGEGTTCDDSPCPTSCLGDINEDGQVSTNDLLTVIANWGPCP